MNTRRPNVAAGFCALVIVGCSTAGATSQQAADILITGGTVITMDSARRVLDDGAVAIVGDRIVAVGTSQEIGARFQSRQVIDARRKVVMPGLIDGHGHAGHGLLKTLGTDNGGWNRAAERMYARGSTTAFWKADALLAGVERLKGGVTTSLTLFGGGNDVYRTDDPKYGDAYMDAIEDVGVRCFLAVGPRRGPFPSTFTNWNGETSQDVQVPFAKQMEVSEALIRKWNGAGNGRVKMAVVFPTFTQLTIPAHRRRDAGVQGPGSCRARPVEAHGRVLRAGWAHARHGEVCGRTAWAPRSRCDLLACDGAHRGGDPAGGEQQDEHRPQPERHLLDPWPKSRRRN